VAEGWASIDDNEILLTREGLLRVDLAAAEVLRTGTSRDSVHVNRKMKLRHRGHGDTEEELDVLCGSLCPPWRSLTCSSWQLAANNRQLSPMPTGQKTLEECTTPQEALSSFACRSSAIARRWRTQCSEVAPDLVPEPFSLAAGSQEPQ